MARRFAVPALIAGALVLAPPASAAVVISEVGATGPGALPAAASDEFVELANAGGATVDASGWKVRFADADCSSRGPAVVLAAGTTLVPGQRLLVVGTAWTGLVAGDAAIAGPDRIEAASGGLLLEDASGRTVDAVAYGDPAGAECGEGSVAPVPPTGGSIERVDGTLDTDDNGADFSAREVREPHNVAGTPVVEPPAGEEPPGGGGGDGGGGDAGSAGGGTAGGGGAAPGPATPAEVLPLPGPHIASLRFQGGAPRVGRDAILLVRAGAPGLTTTALEVRADGGAGAIGESACRLRPFGREFAPGRVTTFRVPIRFTRPGTHELTVVVTSGGCGAELGRTTRTVPVTVAGRRGSSAGATSVGGASPAAVAARASRRCRDANLAVSRRTIRRVNRAVVCLVNQVRRQRRRGGLRPSRALARAALAHARDMRARGYFAHEGPGGPALIQRLRRARYRSPISGENIGYVVGRPTASGLLRAWLASPPHLANMTSRAYRFAGVGTVPGSPVAGDTRRAATFTMNFGRRR